MNKTQVFEMLGDGRPHRKQFSASNGVQKSKSSPTFSVPFDSGLLRHFHDGTGKTLTYGALHDQFFCFLRTVEDISAAEAWAARQGPRVFIRNLLSSTVALDYNFVDNKSGQKTKVGLWEEAAKHSQDAMAMSNLTNQACAAINDISYLREANLVCAVPAMTEKGFDLPTSLTAMISQQCGKPNWTPNLVLSGKARSAKNCSMDEKWDAWANAKLEAKANDLGGKSVILLDDKYQSGLTMHFIADKLLALGAREVHGLAMVKTLRDTDNLDVIEN